MKKKKILLQCQGTTYYYFGLAAIYTKYPEMNVEVDVLFSSGRKNYDVTNFIEQIKHSKYKNKLYVLNFKKPIMYKKLQNKKKNIINTIKYYLKYRIQLIKEIKNQINFNTNYSEIFFSHERRDLIGTSLKFLYPNAKFIMYGDGPGRIMGSSSKLQNLLNKKRNDYIFFNEIKPDQIIALAPYTMDNSANLLDVPILGTDNYILKNLIKQDFAIQNRLDIITNKFINKYKYDKKTILLLSTLDYKHFMMSKSDQINFYVDIINKYCEDNSLLILKKHPGHYDRTLIKQIKEKVSKKIKMVYLPNILNDLPIEIYSDLLKNVNNVISCISSSKISLKCIYGIDCIDTLDVIQKYDIKYFEKIVKGFRIICERYSSWDKKSLIYSENIIPKL